MSFLGPRSALNLAFVKYPGDWIGRVAEVYADGVAMLAESWAGRERHEHGEVPVRTLAITPGTTTAEMLAFIEGNSDV